MVGQPTLTKGVPMSVDEATRVVQEIINMQENGMISKEDAFAAIKKVPHYSELLAT